MKKTISLLLVIALLALAGCSAHIHKVGDGPQNNEMQQQRQWYILWGLVPLNEVNTNAMAGDATDYEIRTETAPLDVIMNIFTMYVTVNSRTVTVTK